MTFFRGRKEQLLGGPALQPGQKKNSVLVLEEGKPERILSCPGQRLQLAVVVDFSWVLITMVAV